MSVALFLSLAQAASVELSPGDDVGALTAALGPGDEVVFAGGVYELTNGLHWVGAGTEAAPIVLRADVGATPVLRLTAGGHIVRIADSTFLTMQGLILEGSEDHQAASGFTGLIVENSADILVSDVEVRQTGSTGVYLGGDNSRITLTGLHVHDVRDGNGITAGCWNASCWTAESTIEWSWIHDLQSENATGIQILPGGQGIVVVDNMIHDVLGTGLSTSSTEFGPANVVERNALFSLGRDGIRANGPTTIRNNVLFGVGNDGVRVWDEGALEQVVISHNTVVDVVAWAVRIDDWAGKTGMVFANNAVVNPTGRAFHVDEGEIDATNRISGNVVTGLVEGLDPDVGHFDAGNGYGDLFDVAAGDLYPTTAGAYVAMGDTAAESRIPAEDYSGYPRDAAAPDVGAYAYVGESNPAGALAAGFKDVAPPLDEGAGVGGCCGSNGSEAGIFLWPLIGLWAHRRRRAR